MRVCVLGSGPFGTSLANVLAVHCEQVWLWGRNGQVVDSINTRHENSAYLAGIPLSPRIRATLSLEEALSSAGLVVSAVPSHATRNVMRAALPSLPSGVPILTVSKAIEPETLYTMTQMLKDCLPASFHPFIGILSGPSFAQELARGLPTTVTIAATDEALARYCQRLFQTPTLRTYTNTDVIGVEIGGALKNVIAIAVGMIEGLGFGFNTRSAIITLGLAEISRLAVHLGADPRTLSGLSGMGDLVLTCTGELSRSWQVGFELAKDRALEDIFRSIKKPMIEGVKTAQSAHALSTRTGVELPICHQVYLVTYHQKSARAAMTEVIDRQFRELPSGP
ncbi:glycerol 3-phosphate dehydrogenase (NAD(P)+) [Stigmatella aurantiaca]|uniref:Glycerol-3-phosphate dehydrogenase [NAD(P)+] n=1 Tax=Stigmatella aurantiaca TaxID=41 RepID=A0A1H7VLD5_STIAU|nr:NAD(P)H-dependent glycerol-3-phosphate dehydrogenase [Stigmatella aurantiaca]SEM09608.1 glycerol 3-phosphate dehydrogenase (NAD(P)+) [Stigmatella aurantiaca]